MTILKLERKIPDANDVVKSLHEIADQIEADSYGYPVTTAIVILGHTQITEITEEVITGHDYWDTFAVGPRCDTFTIRGLMLTAAQDFSSRE